MIAKGLKHTKADAAIITAPVVEQIAKSPDMLELVTNKLDTIIYGGGDVSQGAGSTFAAKSKVFGIIGATETGVYTLLRPSESFPSQVWKYMHPYPAAGLEVRPSVDGLFKAFVVKDRDYEDQQPVLKVFLNSASTLQRISSILTLQNQISHGRADDIIVFKTTFLCQPIAIEQYMAHYPKVPPR